MGKFQKQAERTVLSTGTSLLIQSPSISDTWIPPKITGWILLSMILPAGFLFRQQIFIWEIPALRPAPFYFYLPSLQAGIRVFMLLMYINGDRKW